MRRRGAVASVLVTTRVLFALQKNISNEENQTSAKTQEDSFQPVDGCKSDWAFCGLWRGHHVDTLPFLQEATGNTIFPPPRFRFRSKVILRFFVSPCIHFGAAHQLSFSGDKVKVARSTDSSCPYFYVQVFSLNSRLNLRHEISIECRVDNT